MSLQQVMLFSCKFRRFKMLTNVLSVVYLLTLALGLSCLGLRPCSLLVWSVLIASNV